MTDILKRINPIKAMQITAEAHSTIIGVTLS